MNDSISTDGWPPSFTLDQERILNLLTGDRFYSDSSAALREAILNAVDAIHRRHLIDESFTPSITVIFDRNTLTLLVSDNGDGMDQSSMTQLFTRIGASAAALDASKGSVGEFGIGVISYFMAGDSFSVQTFDGSSEPIGLNFTRQMLAGGKAESVEPTQNIRGTTLEINLRDTDTFELLLGRFPSWCRDVQGLTGSVEPEGIQLRQGGSDRPDAIPGLPTEKWVERAHLSPISGPSSWDDMSGESTISVLYRGVFVQQFTVRGLWGIQGTIDVDPKHFRPRLNREGFVEGEFRGEVEQFLKQAHPIILQAMAAKFEEAFSKGDLDRWTERRWATLWLSVPRDPLYGTASQAWDRIFRKVPAFELAAGNKWEPMSFEGLLKLDGDIFVAPHPDERTTEVINAALRLMRNTGRNVIRGFTRDRSWLRYAGNSFGTTADLIASVFAHDIPQLTPLAPNAEKILAELTPVATLFVKEPSIDLVRIGRESPPVLKLQSRLIINIDHLQGIAIVEDALAENTGRWSLIAITARHSHEYLPQVAAAVIDSSVVQESLGLVKKRFIKGLLS